MTLADDLLPTAYDARGIAGSLGFRPHTVTIVTEAHDLANSTGPLLTPLTEANGQPPRVKWLKDEAVPIGMQQPDVIQIGPVTPVAANLTVLEPLRSDVDEGTTRHVMITGPHAPDGKKYRVLNIDVSRPLGWKIKAMSETHALQGLGI